MQAQIRNDFPILEQKINNNPLIYFDNGATTQMPNCVLECLNRHYMQDNANVHRGIHTLSERSTCAMEDARKTVADFIGCDDPMQIIFTRGATDSLNQVAFGQAAAAYAKRQGGGDSGTEFGTSFRFCPVAKKSAMKPTGAEFVEDTRCEKTRRPDIGGRPEREPDESVVIVSVTAISNVTGTVLPVREIIQKAHQYKSRCVSISFPGNPARSDECAGTGFVIFLAFPDHKTMVTHAGDSAVLKRKEVKTTGCRREPLGHGGGMVDVVRKRVDDEVGTADSISPEAGTSNVIPELLGLVRHCIICRKSVQKRLRHGRKN
ncbi:MAG: aminotransferase class V-fold PLP-dependent enzyme [Eubacterium sp.]